MNENGDASPPETVLCGRCASVCDPDDNFCRHCGLPLHEQQLPSVRDGHEVPAVWQPPLPPVVVKGAAFVAAGTLAEVLVRRLVRGVLRNVCGVCGLVLGRAFFSVLLVLLLACASL